MGKLDYKRGRFSADLEINRITTAMEGWRLSFGDVVDWYHLLPQYTQIDPVYDEATGTGRKFAGPITIPCQHVVYTAGDNERTETGFYYSDNILVLIAFSAFTRVGFAFADLEAGIYDNDRIVYKRKLYSVASITIRGQVQERATIIAVNATQLKPYEVTDDPIFANWAQGGPQNSQGLDTE